MPPTAPAVRVDLLSDTLTKPTEAMRTAMAAAPVGDDVFGEDPTVRELEQRVAGLLGHEDGLFTPSGTMANQLGLRLHVSPGEELVADSLAHVLRAEMGAAAALSGISSRSWVADHGLLDAAQPLALMIPDGGAYQVNTRLVVVENTHNFGGGTVQPLDQLEALRAGTRERGVAMHLDGARLWNAHVATGVSLDAYGRLFDTVSVCLSKGLGAPVGSVLAGSRDQMTRARIWRKRFGGGMRQVGILAAAGMHALDHHVERLADDHARAHRFAEAAAAAATGSVDPAKVQTNIVVLEVAGAGWTPAGFVEQAAARGIRLYPVSSTAVRLVWHLDVDDAGTDLAVEELVPLLAKGPQTS
ncbi:MAG TPA: GntG family PLP-dependent aldolase [Pedococcus sp.]|jgi:threonine aldolase